MLRSPARFALSPRFMVLVLLGLAVLGAGALPATDIQVDTTLDEVADNGNCTLREAILAANTNLAVDGCDAGQAGPPNTDRVLIPAGLYVLSVGASGEDDGEEGDLDLTDNVSVEGAGARLTVIDGGGIDRVFDVDPNGDNVVAAIVGLTVRNGDAGGGEGGGVRNDATLTIDRVLLTGNSAGGPGGAIRNDDDLFVLRSTLAGNTTGDHGGGLDNHGSAFLENVTVSGNMVTGGGVGGGLYNLSGETMTISAVTVVGNSAGAGDAIHNAGTLTATNALLSGDCDGEIDTSNGGSLESPGDTCGLDGPGDQVSVADPVLGPLADNGGETDTHALLPGSPAIEAGNTAACPAADQRGVTRPFDGDGDGTPECDGGAFESDLGVFVFGDGFESGDTSAWSATVP